MDSLMIYIPVEAEVTVTKTMRYGLDFYVSRVYTALPKAVDKWIVEEVEGHFELSEEEEDMMEQLCMRKVEFEVEVWYRETESGLKPSSAKCHTVCPGFVRGWVELEAMKQFTKEHECQSNGILLPTSTLTETKK